MSPGVPTREAGITRGHPQCTQGPMQLTDPQETARDRMESGIVNRESEPRWQPRRAATLRDTARK